LKPPGDTSSSAFAIRLEETRANLRIIEEKFEKRGFSFFATELKSTGEMIGFVGLNIPGSEAHFRPCVEIGWRLARTHWGQGYATRPEERWLC
jgi:RimJ/RimL family protein N-acetyltransferase